MAIDERFGGSRTTYARGDDFADVTSHLFRDRRDTG